jgi:hypothetical protein
MVFENPFQAPGRWYRANLHAHTTNSDGTLSPAEAAEFYRRAGYDLLAITDHWKVSDLESDRSDFLLLPGVELHGGRAAQGDYYHILALNVRRLRKMERPEQAQAQDLVNLARESGGEAVVAHPYWSGLMASDIVGLEGCLAVEVYNATCDLAIMRGYSMVQWDDLLTLGHDLGGIAVDDGHRGALDQGFGWTMIRAEELTVESVMSALRRGLYYSSAGPELKDIRVGDGTVRVATSPVKSIGLVSRPAMGARLFAPEGQELTSAEFRLPRTRYARLQVVDRDGKMAWSNPLLLGA